MYLVEYLDGDIWHPITGSVVDSIDYCIKYADNYSIINNKICRVINMFKSLILPEEFCVLYYCDHTKFNLNWKKIGF